MKKIIRLTESDLARIVKRVIMEDEGPVFEKLELYFFLDQIRDLFLPNKTGWFPDDEGPGTPLTKDLLKPDDFNKYVDSLRPQTTIKNGNPMRWKFYLVSKDVPRKPAKNVYCYITGKRGQLKIVIEPGENPNSQQYRKEFVLSSGNDIAWSAIQTLEEVTASYEELDASEKEKYILY